MLETTVHAGHALHDKLTDFDDCNMLGCVGHAINLAAKVGLKSINEDTIIYFFDDEHMTFGNDSDNAIEKPNSIVTIIKQIITDIRRRRQKLETFKSMVKAAYPAEVNLHSLALVQDVQTR